MPALDRRAFIAGTAAAASPVAALAATSAGPDPVFAAIAAWHQADAAWLARLAEFGRAEDACHAEKAILPAAINVELCGVPFTFKTGEEISYFLRTLPNRGASAPENAARLEEAGGRFRAKLEAERERVEMVRSKHRFDVLDAQAQTASMVADRALVAAIETTPTTLAGIRALVEFMAVPERLHSGHEEAGLATLAAACRTLLPAA